MYSPYTPSHFGIESYVCFVGPPRFRASALSAAKCSLAVLNGYGLTMFSRGQSFAQSPQRAETGGFAPIRGSEVPLPAPPLRMSAICRGLLQRQYSGFSHSSRSR